MRPLKGSSKIEIIGTSILIEFVLFSGIGSQWGVVLGFVFLKDVF